MKHTLPNGVVLDDDLGFARVLQLQAASYGLNDIRVFVATHPEGWSEYLVVRGQEQVFASQNSDAVSSHLTIMGLSRNWEKDNGR